MGSSLLFSLCVCVSHRSGESDGERLVWQLLSLVAEDNRVDLQRYLRRAMDQWSRAGSLTHSLVADVCSHVHHQDHMKVRELWWCQKVRVVFVSIFPLLGPRSQYTNT